MSETESKNTSSEKTSADQAAKEEAAKKVPVKKHARSRHNKKQHVLVPLLLVLIVAVAALGYGLWQSGNEQQQDLTSKFTNLYQQLDQLQRAQRYQSDEQQSQLNTLDEKQQALERSFSSLLKNSAHLKNDWLLAEAEYLVKLANHRLLLEQDINTAITALLAADDRLKQVADPSLLEVRKVLAEQTQALRAVEQPDITGMALQISALKNQLNKLPMKTPDPETIQQREQAASHASQVKDWKALPEAIWQDLKSLVIIRNHSQAVQPLIPPEQHYFLLQNLNLQLEQARLALLQGNNSLYIDSLSSAKQWVETYFDQQQQVTRSMLESISSLAGKNIEPVIPDISNTFKALQDYRNRSTLTSDNKAETKTETGKTQDEIQPPQTQTP